MSRLPRPDHASSISRAGAPLIMHQQIIRLKSGGRADNHLRDHATPCRWQAN